MSFNDLKQEGNTFFQKGDYAQANGYYDQCIKLEPTNPIGYSNKAMSLIKQGNHGLAVETCQEGLKYTSSSTKEATTIKRKLEYRLELAKRACHQGQKHSSSSSSSSSSTPVPITISEVDQLPAQYASL
ncbi:Tah1p NDAI_0I00440 [Naumovozyma dairenensis CBS 421]|uniref:Uncharacterized protein n=1 Tax=Naumovozyma dairenensis (strain ATCC 10597 / BCRC 20456 / CBS 421 / NBRC 0211 / NRRL Y-12639) TaxID=1071378 RepID=G0WFQ2_NAUDC|nr:hypothetical protein NDAI_0I00440 [Naumovozyma dairenensis CBS 421]CCD26613.1 hypothetical protein NDAI_0I00440 [Naumovozyma dairenensis CBS 421]